MHNYTCTCTYSMRQFPNISRAAWFFSSGSSRENSHRVTMPWSRQDLRNNAGMQSAEIPLRDGQPSLEFLVCEIGFNLLFFRFSMWNITCEWWLDGWTRVFGLSFSGCLEMLGTLSYNLVLFQGDLLSPVDWSMANILSHWRWTTITCAWCCGLSS